MDIIEERKNSFGSIDIRVAVPKGCAHVPGKRLQPLCRKLCIPFAEALVGFAKTRFGYKAVTNGVVVGTRRRARLLRAIEDRAARAKTPEQRAQALKRAQERLEARFAEAIKSEFPLIPASEITDIVNHACKKRSGRVGRTGNLPIQDAAVLAVRAHIRHSYTDYDQILYEEMELIDRHDPDAREEARYEAREQVAGEIDAKCKEWGQVDLGTL